MEQSALNAYEIIEQHVSEELHGNAVLLSHKKTAAKVVLIETDDDNKVFYVGFKTPPKDDTGVAHILEHSVLCGSKNFPLKDPFVELVKGSLNTFLNAMTYPDKTVYPVASCNDKDFQNLLHVYLDAVFYPNMRTEQNIFRQEGWHYELENKEDDLTINGVVYNEMKGVFSSPDDVLDREVFNSLFPHNEYGKESGGSPEAIPTLTYEQFVDFHTRYYHPSNSYLYLYGNMDMVKKLEWIDEHYLSHFEYLEIDSSIADEPAFTQIQETRKEYSITEAENTEDNTYLSYNVVVGHSLDPELYIAFSVLDYVLCTAPGAPIKKALIEKGIGKEIYSVFENGIQQPYFSIVAKGANEEQKQVFIETIESVIAHLTTNGIDEKALRAGINHFEFKYREADFGSYPKGLIYGLQLFDSWLYDEKRPFIHLEANETYAHLKEMVGTSYYKNLLIKYFMENTHKSTVIVVPVKGLTAKRDQVLLEQLQGYKSSLSNEELEQIIAQTQELKVYQETPNTPEELAMIPQLTREDIGEFIDPIVNVEKVVEGTTYLYHPIFTNGIAYLRLLFQADQLPTRLLPYVGLLKSILGYVDTNHYEYQDLFHEIDLQTGGISSGVNSYIDARDLDKYQLKFEIKAKVLYPNIEKAFALIEEMILFTKLDDTKRLYEIIAELKSRTQATMTSAGHSLASLRALATFSHVAAISEQMSGLSFYQFLADLEENFQDRKESLVASLQEVMECLFRPEGLMVDCIGTEDVFPVVEVYGKSLKTKLNTVVVKKESMEAPLLVGNEGLMTSAQVQYVCKAGNFIKKGLPYTGALRVLRVIMGYEYLWNQVRVKGGAYGCMSSFTKSGDSYFVSYRDPNLVKTLDTYNGAPEFLRTFEADERTIMKFIIGALGELETPLTPALRGIKSLGNYLSNVTKEDMEKEREELLSINEEVVRGMAKYVEAVLEKDCICVVGNEDMIQEHARLFDETKHLF